MRPFSEDKLFEQGRTTDQFFATGSSSTLGDGGFETPLRNKVQIRMSFPVRNSVEMLRNSSSIYYYNASEGQWNIPTRSINDHVGPFDRAAFTASPYRDGTRILEDNLGFNAIGGSVMSGSLTMRRAATSLDPMSENIQSDPSIGDTYPVSSIFYTPSQETYINSLTKEYPKNIFLNSDYSAKNDQTFTLPIDSPFLIEKIVIETPLYCGRGWFEDKTSMKFVEEYDELGNLIDGGATSFGMVGLNGPAVTMSVMCQKNYGRSTIRDLVGSEIITHDRDFFTSSILFEDVEITPIRAGRATISGIKQIDSNFSSTGSIYNPSVVFAGDSMTFSGSVTTKINSAVSNGLNLRFTLNMQRSPTSGKSGEAVLQEILSKKLIPASRIVYAGPFPGFDYSTETKIMSIDPFGRGMTGFSPSGGSIFGKEYCTVQSVDDDDSGQAVVGDLIRNPFYVDSSEKRNQIIADYTAYVATALAKGAPFLEYTFFTGLSSFGTKMPSPYLVNPGERLLLAASKTSPAVATIKRQLSASVPEQEKGMGKLLSSSFASSISDGIGHDVQLASGTINVTFYGSYVKENKEYIP